MKDQDRQSNFFVGIRKQALYLGENRYDHYDGGEYDFEEDDEEDNRDEEDDL